MTKYLLKRTILYTYRKISNLHDFHNTWKKHQIRNLRLQPRVRMPKSLKESEKNVIIFDHF